MLLHLLPVRLLAHVSFHGKSDAFLPLALLAGEAGDSCPRDATDLRRRALARTPAHFPEVGLDSSEDSHFVAALSRRFGIEDRGWEADPGRVQPPVTRREDGYTDLLGSGGPKGEQSSSFREGGKRTGNSQGQGVPAPQGLPDSFHVFSDTALD